MASGEENRRKGSDRRSGRERRTGVGERRITQDPAWLGERDRRKGGGCRREGGDRRRGEDRRKSR